MLFSPNVKAKWVDPNFHIIDDLLVQPRAEGVAGTLIFVHIDILYIIETLSEQGSPHEHV